MYRALHSDRYPNVKVKLKCPSNVESVCILCLLYNLQYSEKFLKYLSTNNHYHEIKYRAQQPGWYPKVKVTLEGQMLKNPTFRVRSISIKL